MSSVSNNPIPSQVYERIDSHLKRGMQMSVSNIKCGQNLLKHYKKFDAIIDATRSQEFVRDNLKFFSYQEIGPKDRTDKINSFVPIVLKTINEQKLLQDFQSFFKEIELTLRVSDSIQVIDIWMRPVTRELYNSLETELRQLGKEKNAQLKDYAQSLDVSKFFDLYKTHLKTTKANSDQPHSVQEVKIKEVPIPDDVYQLIDKDLKTDIQQRSFLNIICCNYIWNMHYSDGKMDELQQQKCKEALSKKEEEFTSGSSLSESLILEISKLVPDLMKMLDQKIKDEKREDLSFFLKELERILGQDEYNQLMSACIFTTAKELYYGLGSILERLQYDSSENGIELQCYAKTLDEYKLFTLYKQHMLKLVSDAPIPQDKEKEKE